MKAKFVINDLVKHTETSEIYTVTDVTIGEFQFFYKLKTDEDINIETLYPEAVLEIHNSEF